MSDRGAQGPLSSRVYSNSNSTRNSRYLFVGFTDHPRDQKRGLLRNKPMRAFGLLSSHRRQNLFKPYTDDTPFLLDP